MPGYYDQKLSAERLKRCYDVATPRVRQYLAAELDHVLHAIAPGDSVIELGCGYGRILGVLAEKAARVVGIDSSVTSLHLAREMLRDVPNCALACMDAVKLAFADGVFDRVVVVQNGISAFHVDQLSLVRECMRVARPGGTVFFSSYAERFWEHRLEWFRLQSAAGLLGEIDEEKTGDGGIVCKDGFTATTVTPDGFRALLAGFDVESRIVEVDESSLFCEIAPR